MMTPEQLAACTGSSVTVAGQWLPHIDAAMAAYSINTPTRQAAFLANVGHESGHLRYVREIWGPTAAQLRYERRFDKPWPQIGTRRWPDDIEDKTNRLAFSLGNEQIGDGEKYKGRGLIQITGRANYRALGEAFGLSLESHPEQLELAKYAALSAGWFWEERNINAYADRGDFDGVCDIINRGHKTQAVGDTNGYAERRALWVAAMKALATKEAA